MFVAALNDGLPGLYMRVGVGEILACGGDKVQMSLNVGVSPPTQENADLFKKLYTDAIADTDIMFRINWIKGEAGFVSRYQSRTKPPLQNSYDTLSFHPWLSYRHPGNETWMRGLDGKRVLIISPFTETLKYQAPRIDEIFGTDAAGKPLHGLPRYRELLYITSPMTHAHPNAQTKTSWDVEFNKMASEVKALAEADKFDVAILCCGGYGAPLAHMAKKVGKKGIVMGSSLYMMFAIRTKRDEEEQNAQLGKLMNDKWIRPLETPPECYKDVEGGCYW